MKDLSNEASRHVSPGIVAKFYEVPHRCRAHIAEARAVVTNPHLVAWRPEARALVDILERALSNNLATVAAFEAAVPVLEEAVEDERLARNELAQAVQAYAQGSLDRKDHLRRRDDVDTAAGALKVRAATRAAAVSAVLAVEPPKQVVIAEDGIRRILNKIADTCIGLKFDPKTTAPIGKEQFERWCTMSDAEFVWVPLLASRIIKESQDKTKPPAADSWRSEPVELPIPAFVEALATFKRDREAFVRVKIAKANAEIEAAMQSRMMLEGPAAQ